MLANLIGAKENNAGLEPCAFRIDAPNTAKRQNGKMLVWENIPRNNWKIANQLLVGHMEHLNNLPLSIVHKLNREEWAFLEEASSALALLARMCKVLPDLRNRVRNLYHIVDFFSYSFRSQMFYGRQKVIPDDQQTRYVLAYWIALGGALFNIRTKHCLDAPVARAICAVLFSRPYRTDWATCPLEEMEADERYIRGLFVKHSGEFSEDNWNSEACIYIPGSSFLNPVFYLAANMGILKQFAVNSEDIPVRIPEARISWDWLPANLDVYHANQDLAQLPDACAALPVNTASNAYAPMYAAYDECGMPIILIPEKPQVWDAMLGLYGLPKRDPLYPESARIMEQLSPRSAHFAEEVADAHGMVYLGVQSLGVYLPELTDSDNPDYQFHAFAADPVKWREKGARCWY